MIRNQLQDLLIQLQEHNFDAQINPEFEIIEEIEGCKSRNLLGESPLKFLIKEVSADMQRISTDKFQTSKTQRYVFKLFSFQDGSICYRKQIS